MGMLQNLFRKPRETDEAAPPVDAPARTRTFSASGFREAEIARELEAHRVREEEAEADVLTPDIAPVAEVLIDQEEERLAEAPLPAPPAPEADPLPWDEAVGWLSQRSAGSRNFVAQYWNWDYDLRVVEFLVAQPDMDAGVAAGIFWLTAASEDYFPWTDEDPANEIDHKIAELTSLIGRRFAEGDLAPAAHGFDDSWDCVRLKSRLTELYAQGRLDWSPENIPTQSSGELLGFEDIPEDERDETLDFIARFGVR